jgi:ADP-ribose pyrophosphatase
MIALERSKRPNTQFQILPLKHFPMPDQPNCTPPKKLTQERFLNLFATEIERKGGHHTSWVFASRKKILEMPVARADAVVIVAVVAAPDEPRLVLTREFRAPLGAYELSFPSGLIDPGESPVDAAVREFKEETGMMLGRVALVSPPTASSAGLTDETIAYVFAEASGAVSRAFLTEHEDIEVRLATIADIRGLLGSPQPEIISSRLYPLLVGYAAAGVIALPAL